MEIHHDILKYVEYSKKVVTERLKEEDRKHDSNST